jgi:hypothetical protein
MKRQAMLAAGHLRRRCIYLLFLAWRVICREHVFIYVYSWGMCDLCPVALSAKYKYTPLDVIPSSYVCNILALFLDTWNFLCQYIHHVDTGPCVSRCMCEANPHV